MKKHEIINLLTDKSGIKRKEVLHIIDNFLDIILKNVDNCDRIEFRGFGSFYRASRKERNVYSPIAGRKINIPAKSVLAFKASKATEKYPEQ